VNSHRLPPNHHTAPSHGRYPGMNRWLTLAALALVLVAAPVQAAGISGDYLESRTCDVWTGPCFANAEMNLGGKQAVLAWKVKEGTFDSVRLDGLSVGELIGNVVAVESADVALTSCHCEGNACYTLKAGKANVETRCLDSKHDKVCGNEGAFYPPLATGVKAKPALTVEHSFTGKVFNETWKESDRRGAYVGSFELR